MKVAVIGANGQLGVDLCLAFAEAGHEVIALTHAEIRVEAVESVESGVLGDSEVVVNTAAFHNLDRCEDEPLRAFEVNAVGPLHLARWAEREGRRLVHISTDYVFRGDRREPYREDDLPGPQSAYAVSKLAGEHAALGGGGSAAVVRVCGLYGAAPCRAKAGGDNFVKLMLRLGREKGKVQVVTDQWATPTYTRPIAEQIVEIAVRPDLTGVFHATSQGACSWYEFACAIFEEAGMEVEVTPVTGQAISRVRRPAYSVLENARLQALGLDRLPHWRDGLRAYLREIGAARAIP